VLVVDDDRAVRDSLRWLLEVEGYRVVTAANGENALAMLHKGLRPCLILLDLTMPGMDGVTFRRLQLADQRLAAIPVVIISARADRPVPLGSLRLAKPVDPAALLNAVRRHCSPR
jgi:CheY-like chemotaxis protein